MNIMTDRLLLREFIMEDWEAVHQYASDPQTVAYMIWGPNTPDETKNFLVRCMHMQEQNPRWDYDFAVIEKATNRLIGGCNLHIDETNGEIGYCFHKDYWGKGFGTEAAKALLSFGFEKLGLHRIYATCRPENRGSSRVMEKVGMRQEAHLRQHFRFRDSWQDSYLYAILEQEWKNA